MKNKLFCAMVLALCVGNLQAEITETATQAVTNMGLGWNLGNTLDANVVPSVQPSAATYWGQQGLDSENCWGQPTTKSELLNMMRNAGFGAIRVPVTWYNHMNANGQVDPAWMARVKEVVDYVLSNDMYCILNVHHDTGANEGTKQHWLQADPTIYSNYHSKYEQLWQQIATTFRDYGKELLFESYNEMLDANSSWCFASMNTPNGYDATIANGAYTAINSYAQGFVNTVRATGGNNATRNLVVNTYAASNGYGTWNSHLMEPLTRMNRPTDSTPNHIIFQVHCYPSLVNDNGSERSITDINQEVDGVMNGLVSQLASKGAPVIIGEWGTSNVDAGAGKNDYDAHRPLMMQFADHFVKAAKSRGIGTFFWMGMSDGLCRSIPAFSQADLAECLAKAYHGPDFQGEYPAIQAVDTFVCFEGKKALGWGVGLTIPADMIRAFGAGLKVQITYKQTGYGDDIQLNHGGWKGIPFIVGNTTYNGDFCPSQVFHSPLGSTHTTNFSFDAATYQQIASQGLIVHGNSIEVHQLLLLAGPRTDIETPSAELYPNDGIYYNLLGQPTTRPGHGVYILNGKKVLR